MNRLRVGLVMTGSFCTFDKTLNAAAALTDRFDFLPIMSETAYGTDTRFGSAADFRARLEDLTGREILHSIPAVEPLGPKDLCDVLLIAPCTGNTLAKLAGGMIDSCAVMAAKSQLRAGKPVLLAPSTNDGLSGSAGNIAALLQRKNIYFLPVYQDDPVNKPNSLASDYQRLEEAILAARDRRQLPFFAHC